MFAIAVRFDLHNDAAAAQFDALSGELVREISAHEPGTLLYATHTVESEPLARVFYELYADEAAFQAHQNMPHVQAFLEARAPLLAGRRPERLTPAAIKGLTG